MRSETPTASAVSVLAQPGEEAALHDARQALVVLAQALERAVEVQQPGRLLLRGQPLGVEIHRRLAAAPFDGAGACGRAR